MWDELALVLAGATSTLGATTLVQLIIVPRVESRKRREDRWERDVTALTEFLAIDFDKAQSEVVSSLYGFAFLAELPEDVDKFRVAEWRDKNERKRREAFDGLRQAEKRVQHMLDRVLYLDQDQSRRLFYRHDIHEATWALDRLHYRVGDETPAQDEVAEAARKSTDAVKPVEEYLATCVREGRAARRVSVRRRARRKWNGMKHKRKPKKKPAKRLSAASGDTKPPTDAA